MRAAQQRGPHVAVLEADAADASEAGHGRDRGRGRGRRLHPAVAIAIAMAGVLLMLYPSAASWLTAVQQQGVGEHHTEAVTAIEPADRDALLAQAHDYNAQLASGALLDPFTTPLEAQDGDDPYWQTLPSDDDVMGIVRIPAIDLELPIFHGTSDAVLDRGLGHLLGSSLPVGGEGTHAVLTGHSGLPNAELLTRLDELEPGDQIEIEVYGEAIYYEVISTQVVLPVETEGLRTVPGSDLVTFVTCTPTGINSHRLLVTAERIDAPTEAPFTDDVEPVGPPWWAIILGVVVAAVMTLVLVQRRRAQRRLVPPGSPT